MGYNVEPSGRLHLPEGDEAAALAAVRVACSQRDGWFDPDLPPTPETLTDVAWVGAATFVRDGDWIEVGRSRDDFKWSGQAIAFYVALAPFVRAGTVRFEGETGERWSYTYTYADGRITQQGYNGWDGSTELAG
ncbi:hypothetical protein ABZY58_16570 [Micromonospora tulbaghiae]|uniref:hypothetical protein n=1 Tax=Micromonospora tulbaghiae TaxID=479978 RepID=UPI000E088B69|nr:hypothetical protein [Micromonospora provocatoris]RBJ01280.1 hypothetical protein DRA43_19185 [Micromonospora provocatoris]